MSGLELRNLRKDWPSMSVEASFSLPSGKLLSVVGPSGCGKSTMLRLIAGLERPDSGSMLLSGKDVTEKSPRERGVGFVFQDYALFPHLDVAGNVAFGPRAHRVPRAERERVVDRLLEITGLSGYGKRLVSTLSGGERQRVALARTLASGPEVILFDEPLSSLDPGLRRRLRGELRDRQRSLGFTAIYVTHDLDEALSISDSMAIMDSGRILQYGQPADLWERPDSAAAAAFLGNGILLDVHEYDPEAGIARTAIGNFRCVVAVPRGTPAVGTMLFFEQSAVSILPGNMVADKPNTFSARCASADYEGNEYSCRFESGKTAMDLRIRRALAPAPGSVPTLWIDPARARLLPRKPA